jgi:acyl-CoA oxidase
MKIQEKITNDSILRFDPTYIHAPRKDLMMIHSKKLIRQLEIFKFDPVLKLKDTLFFSEQIPLSLHFFMFLMQLKNLCSEEQLKTIYEPALRGEIIGCYAQTELGHGSDVKNLMTTAEYDEST